jgi:tRNA(fMet)-specific endonuclease VapC
VIRYMLDTNICIYIIKRKPLSVIQKLQSLDISDVGISTITLSELEYGVAKSSKAEQNKLALTEFVAPLEILDYDDLAAQQYGTIRASLEAQGQVIGSNDLLIAAHALSCACTLVTNNENEFSRVKGLSLQNWT